MNEEPHPDLVAVSCEDTVNDSLSKAVSLWKYAKDPQGALKILSESLLSAPNSDSIHNLFGLIYIDLKQLGNGRKFLFKAHCLNPFNTDILSNLIKLLTDMLLIDDALEILEAAPESLPKDYLTAQTYFAKKKYSTAEALVNKIIYHHEDALSYDLKARICRHHGDLDSARIFFQKAIELNPPYLQLYFHYGNILRELKRYVEAVPFYKYVIEQEPEHYESLWNLSLCYCFLGDWYHALMTCEARWHKPNITSPQFDVSAAWYRGELVDNADILIWPEQGIADELFYLQYIPDFLKAANSVSIFINQRIMKIVQAVIPEWMTVYDANEFRNTQLDKSYDFHMPLQTMALFGLLESDTPRVNFKNYTEKLTSKRALFRDLAPSSFTKVIAVSYKGGKGDIGRERSLDLDAVADLLNIKDTLFVIIQHGATDVEKDFLKNRNIIWPLEDYEELEPILEILMSVDMVVSVDNTYAHLAALLGQQQIVMTSCVADWRMSYENVSFWYPKAIIIQQNSLFDWSEVIQETKLNIESVCK